MIFRLNKPFSFIVYAEIIIDLTVKSAFFCSTNSKASFSEFTGMIIKLGKSFSNLSYIAVPFGIAIEAFIFDKSSDLTMLFADKRFDISEQVLRVLNRSEKREQLTKKQLKEEELKENREDALDENPIVAERQKALDDKKTSREKILADRKLLQEQKKKEFDDKRKQIQADREAKKNGTVSANVKLEDSSKAQISTDSNKINANETVEKLKQNQADAKTQTVEERKKIIEERKKALEEKRKKILEEREAIKKAKEEKLKENKNNN